MNWKTKYSNDCGWQNIAKEFDLIHPIVLRILFQRGLTNKKDIKSFLFPNYEKDLMSPFLFRDMSKVINRLKKAKKSKEKVLIFGDYDADGITSSLVLKTAFEKIGLDVFVYIPHKEKEGYGLSFKILKKFFDKGIKLVFTVDCGISNVEEIKKAKKIGMDIIITDHHHIPPKIPDALAIINPKINKSGYPFKDLAGVGVAFKLAQAIYEVFLPKNERQHIKWLLDLVAIGTVADMVPLVDENRVIVKFGLLVVSKTKRVGLQEMFKTGNILIDENNVPTTQKISFQIAPRINSASRMSHAEKALFLLDENDRVRARLLALELENQNTKRQKETRRISLEAEKIAKKEFANNPFIFIIREYFPSGILGLVAGRLSNKFNKPTAILKKGDVISKGSFRSIPKINIIEMIERCGELLEAYGGHSQAAGITIRNKNIKRFFDKMQYLIKKELKEKDIVSEIGVDAELSIEDIDLNLADSLIKMEPFGQGNEEPVFLLKNLKIQNIKWVGNGEKHLKLFLQGKNNSKTLEAIGFNLLDKFSKLKKGDKVDIIFNLFKNMWNGYQRVQLKIIDIKNNN